MNGPGRYRQSLQNIALVSLLVCPSSAFAQEIDGGLSALFTYSETARSSNGEEGFTLRSDLGFELSSRTRNQNFELSLNGALEKIGGTSFEDPNAALLYSIESRNTVLSFDASYQNRDVDELRFDEDINDTVLAIDGATREDLRANISMEFGREAAFGATVSLGFNEQTFSDTTSTALLDSMRNTGRVALRFEVNPVMTFRVTYNLNDLDRVNGVDTRSSSLTAGLSYNLSPTLSVDLDLGQSRVTQSGTAVRNTETGYSIDAGMVKELSNGSLRGSFVSNIDENGRRTTIRFDRDLELKRASLSFGAGISEDGENGNTRPLYALNYQHEMPRGNLNASLQQSFGTTTDGDEVLRSRVGLGWRQELTTRSNFNAGISWNLSDQSNGSGSDRDQLDLTIRYNHSLNARWSATAGYQYQRVTEGNSPSDSTNEFFVGLSTSVEWRP